MELEHGKRSTYVHKGCRCELCTTANARYQIEYWRSNSRRLNVLRLSRTKKPAKKAG